MQRPEFSSGQQSPLTQVPAQHRLVEPRHCPSFWQGPVPEVPEVPEVPVVPVVPELPEEPEDPDEPDPDEPEVVVVGLPASSTGAVQAPLTHRLLVQSLLRVHGP